MTARRVALIMAAALATLPLPAPAEPEPATPPSPWVPLTTADIEAIHAELAANHPGAVDSGEHATAFQLWLRLGRARALANAQQVKTFAGYRASLAEYVNGFGDAHVALLPRASQNAVAWPGLLLTEEAGKVIVAEAAHAGDLQLIGAELLNCDARTTADWGIVLGRFYANWDLEALRASTWPLLFIDQGNPYYARPNICTFRTGSGEVTRKLEWRPLPNSDLAAKLRKARRIVQQPPGIRAFGDRGFWMTLSSSATSGPEAQQLHATIETIKSQVASIRKADRIVIDLRGNTGGTSEWADQLVDIIWGSDYANARRDRLMSLVVDWRVSPGNIDYARFVERAIAEEFPGSPSAQNMATIATGMVRAAAANRNFFRELPQPAAKRARRVTASPVRARTFLLMDHGCYSACLDIADLVLAMGDVTIVGQPTAADTTYMQARVVPLPSGLNALYLPTKVYRNRPRTYNQPYLPKYKWEGDIRDTPGLERWIGAL